jgi:hypothetical protein
VATIKINSFPIFPLILFLTYDFKFHSHCHHSFFAHHSFLTITGKISFLAGISVALIWITRLRFKYLHWRCWACALGVWPGQREDNLVCKFSFKYILAAIQWEFNALANISWHLLHCCQFPYHTWWHLRPWQRREGREGRVRDGPLPWRTGTNDLYT